RTLRPERAGELEHQQVAGTHGESAPDVPDDIAEGDRSKLHRSELEEGGQVHRGYASVVEREHRRWGDRDRGETRPVQRAHDEPIELSYVGLNPCRRQAAGRSRAPLAESVTTREDVTVRTRTVD